MYFSFIEGWMPTETKSISNSIMGFSIPLKTVFRYEINIMTGGKIILKKENSIDRVSYVKYEHLEKREWRGAKVNL